MLINVSLYSLSIIILVIIMIIIIITILIIIIIILKSVDIIMTLVYLRGYRLSGEG